MDQEPPAGIFRLIVDRPVAVLMIFTALAVFGLVSYSQLPLNLMPEMSYPSLTVRTDYPGAAPEEVESQVSRLVEEALSTADGLVGIQSRSRAELSDVVLEFNWGTDMSAASQGVRERLQTVWLTEGVERPLILHYDPSLDPILRLALSTDADEPKAPQGEAALFLLRELAEEELKRELESVDGVAAVRVRGGLERQIQIDVREEWLAARRVSVDQVRNTLIAENVNIAGGSIREGDTEYLIRTLNEFSSVEELRALEIQRGDGTRIPLQELATVRESFKERQVVSHLGGREAVELEIFKEADANIVSVADRVKQFLEGTPDMGPVPGRPGLQEQLPPGVIYSVLDDQAAFIEDSISNLRGTALLGGLLAVVVLFLFLRDLRATAIIATAIPFSVVCTFAALYLGDVSLNLMSLGGLALGIGMLVDNSVVVLEAIQVYRERGVARADAAVAGAREVAAAVTASTLTTVAVFLPIVFVEGVAGQIFGDLAMAVVFSLLASLAVALVFVPMLAAREFSVPERTSSVRGLSATFRFPSWTKLKEAVAWCRERTWRWLLLPWFLARFVAWLAVDLLGSLLVLLAAGASRVVLWIGAHVLPPLHRAAMVVASSFGRVYDRVQNAYAPMLEGRLKQAGATLFVAMAVFGLALLAGGQIGQELIPEVHQGRFQVDLALPVGTPLDKTVRQVAQLEREIAEIPGVETVYAAIGSEGRADSRPDEGEHSARLLVQVDASGDPQALEAQVSAQVRSALAKVERLDARIAPSSLFSVRTPVEVVVSGQDLDVLRELADAVTERMRGMDGVEDVRSSLVPGYPEVRIRYRRTVLERYGLSTAQVAGAVRDKIQGTEASKLTRGEQRVDLIVQLDESQRSTLVDLTQINVNPQLVPAIPLSAVAVFEEAEGPSEIRRVDQRRSAVIGANLGGLDLASTSEAIHTALRGVEFPDGFDYAIAGQTLEMERSLRSLSFALLLAVFLVYVIMASTFESLVHPFVILFSVPMAAVGVVPVLLASGQSLSVVVFIGFIVLAGMVVNNAIVLVDRINQNRAGGMERTQAILTAGRARLRPILITTFTTALGLLPLSLGIGAGAEIQQPLAITVISGLVASTLLTLVIVPVVYQGMSSVFDRFHKAPA